MPDWRFARAALLSLLLVVSLAIPPGSVAAAGPARPPQEAPPRTTIDFTTDEGTWVSLDVAPNGRWLAMELLGDIYALRIGGGRARVLLDGPAFQSQPRFSPDGGSLVYVSDEAGSDDLWVAQADGSEVRRVTALGGPTVLSPSWSPDGDALYATVIQTGFQAVAEIWRFDVATGEGERVVENANGPPARLVSAPAPGPYGPVPSADGTSVYFTSVTPRPYGSRDGGRSSVMRLDVATGQTHPVTLEGLNAMKPSPSPDRRWLVYGAMRDGRTGLKVRDVATGVERWLAYPIQRHQLEGKATRDVLPNFAFTPDSSAVVAAWGGRIRRIEIEDGSVERVPFEARVSLDVAPRLTFPRRVDGGPVRARFAYQLAVGSGGRIAFQSMARIWIAEADGSPRRLTRTARPREFMPAWSRDGNWVAYVTWDESGGHLWKARADGIGEPVRLSDHAALWADPAFTPDGSGVVALTAPLGSTRGARSAVPPDARVVLVPAEGGAARTLAAAEGARHPHFGAALDRVYLSTATGALISISLSDGSRRVEASLPRGRGPGGGRLAISPAGDRLLAMTGAGLVHLPVPAQPGGELDPAQGEAVTATRPASFAWTANGAAVVWLDGVRLSWLDVGAAPDRTGSTTLEVEAPRPRPAGTVVLRGARIVTMRGDEILDEGDILVRDHRIAAVGPSGTLPIPADAAEIDVAGTTIVPGFIDLHAHFAASAELLEPESSTTFANLAYGITTVRNPQAPLDVFALADVVEADAVPSPRIVSTGPGLFGSLRLGSLDQARAIVRRYRDEYGTHVLKSYLVGTRQQQQWIAEAARELGMMPTTEGGASTKLDMTHAFDGFSGNEHAFPVAPIHDDLVQLIARTGITYTPTLVVSFGGALPIYRLLAEERPHESTRISRWFGDGETYASSSSRLLAFPAEDYNDTEVAEGAAAILRAGGRVALGGHGEVQGLSNHWEMKLLAGGGMSNHDVLRVATLHGAEAIGYAADLGSIEVGKLADLVVLDRNPLDDIEATQSVRYVMRGGVLYDGETLDQRWPRRRPLTLPWSMERSTDPADVVTRIEDLVRTTIRRARIPGVGVAVVRDGEVLLSRGFGVANLETDTPVSDRTMFQSGSLGKQFTAAGIMALAEEGRVDLDGSVRIHLPETPETWQPITLRHLLTHASGIPDYTSESFEYARNYTEDDLVRMASELELEFAAGERWNYSNTGYVMLGVVISRVTERPYWEYLRERIFDPAGMPAIRVNTESEIVPHRAQGYLPTADGWRHADYVAPLTNTVADGSMRLSLRDLVAWNETVRTRAVLSEASWEQIFAPMTLNSGRTYPYGHAWFIEEAGGQTVHQHSGSWQGFVTQYTRYEDDDLAVIVLGNARSLAVMGLASRIATLIDPTLAPEPAPIDPIADPDPEATASVASMLARIADGELELSDFAFVRQTLFPRIRRGLIATLEGRGAPDRLELLARRLEGDDRVMQYRVWYGDRPFRVHVSLGPRGGLTALRVTPGPDASEAH